MSPAANPSHHLYVTQSQLSTAGTSNTGKLARIPNISVSSSGSNAATGHSERASSATATSLFSDVTKGGTSSHHSGGRRKSDRGIAVEFEKTPSIVKDKVSAIEKHTTTAAANAPEKMMTAHGEVAVRHTAARKHSSMSSFLGPTKASAERDISMVVESSKKLFESFAYDGPETSSAGNSPPPMGMVMGVDRDRDRVNQRVHPEEKEGASLSRSSSYRKLLLSSDFTRSRGSAFKEAGLLSSLSSPSRYSTEGPCSVSSPQVTPHDPC
jgi:hypothetical protein